MTFSEVGTRIETVETDVSGYLSRLTGDTYDKEGLTELKHLLGGE